MQDDRRLIELEVLGQLAKRGGYMDLHEVAPSLGTPAVTLFKDLVLSLLMENCIAGGEPVAPEPRQLGGQPLHLWHLLGHVNISVLRHVLEGQFRTTIRITHMGHMRLARLREELDRGRVLDPLGILIDGRHIERDLRVRMAMLREGTDLSLLMADLDHFKAVNDSQGHSRGDEALRRYFSILREVVSASDGDAYRRGGDEALAILPGLGAGEAALIAESVRVGVEGDLRNFSDAGLGSPTVSLGVLTVRRPKVISDVLELLDRLLYRAKDEGRNRVAFGTLD
jgi:diguanylate cyclase (GGDEF)-like protein